MHAITKLIKSLYHQQTVGQRAKLVFAMFLMIVSAFFEFKIITLIGPLVATAGSQISEQTIAAATSLAVFAVLGGIARVLQIYVGHGYVYDLGHLLSKTTLRNALNTDYLSLKTSHSASLLKRFEMINVAINSVLTPLMVLLNNLVVSIAIAASLIITNFQVGVFGLGTLGFFYISILLLSRNALLRNAQEFSATQGERIFLIREATSGYRELMIGGLVQGYQERFGDVDRRLRRSQVLNLVLGASPRFVLEALAFMAIAAGIAWSQLVGGVSFSEFMSIVATFAIGAQKLVPCSQAIYSSIASIIGHHSMIQELGHPLFREPHAVSMSGTKLDSAVLAPESIVKINGLGFGYPGAVRQVFTGLKLEIYPGERIALVGGSGSGKSTFLELFCGLLEADAGAITVGGVGLEQIAIDSWQKRIAYVPQQPFLVSGSIRENLLFGTPANIIRDEDLVRTLKSVDLTGWLNNLPNGLEFDVGENGANLSGGQRQRLSIARALLSGRSIFVLDEITSNLDARNEADILDLILSLPKNITVVCSLHKAPDLTRFDKVVSFSGTVPSITDNRSAPHHEES
jgi:ABC-type multidrug transport system fused ATPase/permease subunit